MLCVSVIYRPQLEADYNTYRYRNYIENGSCLLKQAVELFKTLYSQKAQFSISACSVQHGQTV